MDVNNGWNGWPFYKYSVNLHPKYRFGPFIQQPFETTHSLKPIPLLTDKIRKYRASLPSVPSLTVSFLPLILLLGMIATIIITQGAETVQNYGYVTLLVSAVFTLILSYLTTDRRHMRCFRLGIAKSARQILPAIPILIFIGTLSATWMLSGVVPSLIYYGLELLEPRTFLMVACATCAVVSVVTGSSWTTIATIGVALMGVGSVMGYHVGWLAGAIISGAYFGDKVSPLSDTTVLAASTCGVPLMRHIRYLMLTSGPAMIIALAVYLIVGMTTDLTSSGHSREMIEAIHHSFNITPWVLIIPALTLTMIAFRFDTAQTLAAGSLAGLVGMWIFQPQIASQLAGDGGGSLIDHAAAAVKLLAGSTEIATGYDLLDPLVSTGGIAGMLPTVWLVLSAMTFGGAMIATGMLGRITHAITSRLRRGHSLISATVGSGLFLNSCTGDQYMSIIIGGNIFKNTYRLRGLKPQTLSRTLEDSISVTSVLIPWNSCGLTQSTVLGVSTLIYMPFCIFNIASPIMTLIMGWSGWSITSDPVRDSSLARAPHADVRTAAE